MNRRKLPLILMLVAGAVTCIISLIRNYSIFYSLLTLFGALAVFFLLGSIMKWTLDCFDRENEEKKEKEEEAKQENEEKEGEQEGQQGEKQNKEDA